MHDPVPTLPPEETGYHHTPRDIHYTSVDPLKYKICDNSGEDDSCFEMGDDPEDHLHYLGLYTKTHKQTFFFCVCVCVLVCCMTVCVCVCVYFVAFCNCVYVCVYICVYVCNKTGIYESCD